MKPEKIHELVFEPQKLKEARLKKFPDMSGRRVALELLEIAPQRLSEYELGNDNPPPTMLARLCALYGVDLLELTNFEKAA
jgi:transcriptional regulator with XRE-family HTH domain